MSTHTPGPWISQITPSGYWTIRTEKPVSPEDELCSRIASLRTNDVDEATEKANARLIAAAPEMLEALIIAEAELEQHEPPDEYVEMHHSYREIMKTISNAIKKAKGNE